MQADYETKIVGLAHELSTMRNEFASSSREANALASSLRAAEAAAIQRGKDEEFQCRRLHDEHAAAQHECRELHAHQRRREQELEKERAELMQRAETQHEKNRG